MEDQSKLDLTPVLVGCGQIVQRDVEPLDALDPVGLMAESSRRAVVDAGGGADLLAAVDTLAVVHVLTRHYGDPVSLLADELGIRRHRGIYSYIGGETPQVLINSMARGVLDGSVGVALLAGGEAFHSARTAYRQGVDLPWSRDGNGNPDRFGNSTLGSNEMEMRHGLQLPIQIYPLFENALRHHYGNDVAEHHNMLGDLCSGLSEQAVANPYAWFREPKSADQIATVTQDNRYVGFPYTKLMNAIMAVDQGAAVIVTSVSKARELGIDESKWVYLTGAVNVCDHWWVSERVNYHTSPAALAAALRLLEAGGVALEDIDFFDLYSCFPSALQILRNSIGIKPDDQRPLTVTGGLAYHGGAGNNYSMHAVATMMEKLRAAPGATGLVAAMGWYVTKHAMGLYSTSRPGRVRLSAEGALQPDLDAIPHPRAVEAASGKGVIETYTVMHDRDGAPVKGIVVGRLPSKERFVANTPEDRVLLEGLESDDAVKLAGAVADRDGINIFKPA